MSDDKIITSMREFFEYFKIKCPKHFRHIFDNNRKCKKCLIISMSDWQLTDEGISYYNTYSPEFERNEIKKKILNILNKISDENFENQSEKLIKIVLETVNNPIQLHETAKQILYKSLIEPKYIKVYVSMCKKLSHLNIKGERLSVSFSQDKKTDQNLYSQTNFLNFQKEKNDIQGKKYTRQLYKKYSFLKELLNISMEEYFVILNKSHTNNISIDEKKKIVNIMHLIGELYIQDIIYSNIVHNIIQNILFVNDCDLGLESLCKLITIAGKKIDNPDYKKYINEYFKKINHIITNKKGRIKYLMMDVIDLRKSNWIV